MITKKSISANQHIISRLPTNAQMLFQQDLDYTKAKTHDIIWKHYFLNITPTYKEIVKCFNVLKSVEDEPYLYPIVVNDNKIYIGGSVMQTIVPNYFITNLVSYADREQFWNLFPVESISNDLYAFKANLDRITDFTLVPPKLLTILGSDLDWQSIIPRLKPSKMKKSPHLKSLIEANLNTIFNSLDEDMGTIVLFNLIRSGIDFSNGFFDELMSGNIKLLNSDEFKNTLFKATQDENQSELLKKCKTKSEIASALGFIKQIKEHPVYLIIRLS